jgi:hypothetical protein
VRTILAHQPFLSRWDTGSSAACWSPAGDRVFGGGMAGDVLYIIVQTASALILYTGANTSFNRFPFLASFVAADSRLPRQLNEGIAWRSPRASSCWPRTHRERSWRRKHYSTTL